MVAHPTQEAVYLETASPDGCFTRLVAASETKLELVKQQLAKKHGGADLAGFVGDHAVTTTGSSLEIRDAAMSVVGKTKLTGAPRQAVAVVAVAEYSSYANRLVAYELPKLKRTSSVALPRGLTRVAFLSAGALLFERDAAIHVLRLGVT
jgi:hypothetical protein